MDLELMLQREPSQGPRTHGTMFVDGAFECHVLEDEIREIPGEPVELWKVKGKTAIPAGRYRVTLEHSNRFGPDTLTLNDVAGFTAIRMHGGNTEDDTDGCQLLGRERTPTGIRNCAPAVASLKFKVKTALEGGVDVFIDVRNP